MSAIRVLIQAGHVAPREPGFEAGTGTAHEQELTLALQKALLQVFGRDRRFEAVPVPGDIPDGVTVDAALFLHGDGSSNQGSSGYCFGYPVKTVNEKLAKFLAEEINRIPGHPPHRADNYTDGLRFYYGYRRVTTNGPRVLVEHGFLTNPGERLWLFANISKLAEAEYRAVCRYFWLSPTTVDTPEQTAKRLAALRKWILARRAEGWSWERLKLTPNWREWWRKGGR